MWSVYTNQKFKKSKQVCKQTKTGSNLNFILFPPSYNQFNGESKICIHPKPLPFSKLIWILLTMRIPPYSLHKQLHELSPSSVISKSGICLTIVQDLQQTRWNNTFFLMTSLYVVYYLMNETNISKDRHLSDNHYLSL